MLEKKWCTITNKKYNKIHFLPLSHNKLANLFFFLEIIIESSFNRKSHTDILFLDKIMPKIKTQEGIYYNTNFNNIVKLTNIITVTYTTIVFTFIRYTASFISVQACTLYSV